MIVGHFVFQRLFGLVLILELMNAEANYGNGSTHVTTRPLHTKPNIASSVNLLSPEILQTFYMTRNTCLPNDYFEAYTWIIYHSNSCGIARKNVVLNLYRRM